MIFNTFPIITQYFGENPQFYKQWNLFGHEGIDLIPSGDDYGVAVPLGGTVRAAYHSAVYGNTIMVHSMALRMSFRFAHLDYFVVSEGAVLQAGDLIGQMGNSPSGRLGINGKPMGAHLHMNCVPMTEWGKKDFPDNGFKGRVDPLGVLRFLGEL